MNGTDNPSWAKDVVLCKEEKGEIKKIEHHPPGSDSGWTEIRIEVTCMVVRVFKGDLQPGAILHADYDMVFYRVVLGGEGYTLNELAGKLCELCNRSISRQGARRS